TVQFPDASALGLPGADQLTIAHFINLSMPIRRSLPVFLVCLLGILKPATESYAQSAAGTAVQWAGKVIGVCAEKRGEQYGEQYQAAQALGYASKLPQRGESPTAWAPLYPENTTDDWIQVGFAAPTTARQVVVAENVNPGAVTKVVVTDEAGTDHTVYT
uniref:hypothetical protein n=1 Tax=Escherichia coli TaxID=562 RepID=UPI0016B11958